MKLSVMVLMSLIIIFSITFFESTTTVNAQNATISLPSNTGDSSVVWNFLLNPINWAAPANATDSYTIQTSLIAWIIAFALFVGVVGVSMGAFRITVSDAITFTPAVILLLGIAAPSIIMLFGFINKELSPIMCGSPNYCAFPVWLATIICSTLAINWIFAVIQWWRTGFVSG